MRLTRYTGVMLDREYNTQVCSIARSLEVVGERWSLLILRDLGLGLRRFDDIQKDLGITRSVLTKRLRSLVVRTLRVIPRSFWMSSNRRRPRPRSRRISSDQRSPTTSSERAIEQTCVSYSRLSTSRL